MSKRTGASPAINLDVVPQSESILSNDNRIVAIGLLLLFVYYALYYLGHPELPGNHPHPEGWWTWLDQGLYLRSARAFAAFDLNSAAHWYPPGYALLGAPFIGMVPRHPYFLVDLICLLGAAWLFVQFCRGIGVRGSIAIIAFSFPLLVPRLMESWVIPWSSSPAALVMWGLALAVQTAFKPDNRGLWRPAIVIGLLLGSLMLIRPTDMAFGAVMVVPLGAVLVWRALRGEIDARRVLAAALSGGAALAASLALALGLHVMIYGPAASPYMVGASALGFTTANLPWRAFVLLIEPRLWFSDGTGLLQRLPWLVLTLVGLGVVWRFGAALFSVAVAAVICVLLYICFVDLSPIGLWRYGNIHYFKWTWPVFALLALLGIQQLWRRDVVAIATAAVLVIPLSLNARPARLPVDATAFGAFLSGAPPRLEDAVHNPNLLETSRGTLQNVTEYRTAIVPGGLLVMGIRQPLAGPVRLIARPETRPGMLPNPTVVGAYRHEAMIGVRWSVAWPCWLPPYACARRAWVPTL